jgi:hypothetical protein
MDGVGIKGDENVLRAGARRLVLRLVRPDEDHEPLLDLFERARNSTQTGWILDQTGLVRTALMLGRKGAPFRSLLGLGIGGVARTLRSLSSFIPTRFVPKSNQIKDLIRDFG